MYNLGLFLGIFLVFVQSGSALQCWSCSSDMYSTCNDPFNTTKILQQRNNYQQVGSYQQSGNYNPGYQQGYQQNRYRNDMPVLRDCSTSTGQVVYGQRRYMCKKEVRTDPSGRRTYSRMCAEVSMDQRAGVCSDTSYNREFCEYCDYDGCNGANALKTNLLAMLVVPCALLFFLRR